jgi:hypothetical protein
MAFDSMDSNIRIAQDERDRQQRLRDEAAQRVAKHDADEAALRQRETVAKAERDRRAAAKPPEMRKGIDLRDLADEIVTPPPLPPVPPSPQLAGSGSALSFVGEPVRSADPKKPPGMSMDLNAEFDRAAAVARAQAAADSAAAVAKAAAARR